MGGYGQPHTSLAPVVGASGPAYATAVNAAIAELQATLAAKVTPAGMDLNAALSFLSGGTNYPITDLERLNLQNKGAAISAATYPRAVYVVNGDLYYNDGAGNQVRLTQSGAVNVTTSGGITGSGYGSGGVAVNWDSGSSSYQFKSGSGADAYAAIACDDLMLRDGSGNYWRLSSPALAANLDFQLPAAYPGSTSLLQMSSAGVLTASNTVQSVTAAAGQHFIVSSTGRFKHGDIERCIALAPVAGVDGTNVVYVNSVTTASYIHFTATADGAIVLIPLSLDVGARIRSIRCYYDFTTAGTAGTITTELLRTSTAAETHIASQATSGGTDQTVTLSAIDHTVLTDNHYYLTFQVTAGTWDRVARLQYIVLTYDRP